MSLMISQHGDHVLVRMRGAFGLSGIRELVEKLAAALGVGKTLQIRLNGVTEIDTSVLQAFLAVQREGERLQRPVVFLEPSQAFREVCDRLQLGLSFQEPLRGEVES